MRVNCTDCPLIRVYWEYYDISCSLSDETKVHRRHYYSDTCKLVKIVLNDGTEITPAPLPSVTIKDERIME